MRGFVYSYLYLGVLCLVDDPGILAVFWPGGIWGSGELGKTRKSGRKGRSGILLEKNRMKPYPQYLADHEPETRLQRL